MSAVATPVSSPLPDAVERRDPDTRRPVAALSSWVYQPACAIAAAAMVLVAAGWATGWGGDDFAGSVTLLGAVVAGPVTLAIIGVLLVVERDVDIAFVGGEFTQTLAFDRGQKRARWRGQRERSERAYRHAVGQRVRARS